MRLSDALTDYISQMAELFEARKIGGPETEILDRMDTTWHQLEAEEIDAVNVMSKALVSLWRK